MLLLLLLHCGRQVTELHLQLKQQRGVHVEEGVGLGMTCLQEAQPPVQCCGIQASASFVLEEEEGRGKGWGEEDVSVAWRMTVCLVSI